ncbi:hypothetical protein EXIGLDRAFT_832155 [Exidia glandulosa HHB12029]|uniref:MULE transposase domain-containing protein n=1 Tax=Exidia glandulosa HHB12029 TaxID=1314781 RepID=A0A165LXZ1_EXIGL|nr:hypothetical protein EXIGLDRAFT_832155 [Exidia glandulosa HHB12029]
MATKDELIAQARRLLESAGVDVSSEDVVRAVLTQPRDLFSPLGNGGAVPAPSAHDQHANASQTPNGSTGFEPLADGRAPHAQAAAPLREYLSEAVRLRNYEPPPARVFSPNEVTAKANRVNHKTKAAALVQHPYGAIVEYPQTGAVSGEAIAHRFPIDPERPFLPHNSFQYSLGGTHGAHDAKCSLIHDDGRAVACKSYLYSCTGVRCCTFSPAPGDITEQSSHGQHSFTSPSRHAALRAERARQQSEQVTDAQREVFTKTLAFYTALRKLGCAFTCADGVQDTREDAEVDIPRNIRAPQRTHCAGKVLFKRDSSGRSYLECEHRHSADRAHLVLRNLQDYDTSYLEALVKGDMETVRQHEELARSRGYGPLVSCSHTRSCRSQAQQCPHWHRTTDGALEPGLMSTDPAPCSAQFRIYVPKDLFTNPFIVVLCINPHSHPVPERSMTPPPLREAFKSMLSTMDWRLADATPLRVVQDSGFMCSLRQALDWSDPRDPSLSDLHPSLGNRDHAGYIIDAIRSTSAYPCGTDFEGAQHMYRQQLNDPPAQRYVRLAQSVHLPGRTEPVKLIVCMSPSQSTQFKRAKRVQLDMAFNRVKGFLEFEVVTWDLASSQSVTLCRAFTECQSAEAYLELFRSIFRIIEEDTGSPVRVRHIHGDGLEIVTADEHKGQALGLGLLMVELAQSITAPDVCEPQKRLCDLTAYEHLARFFRLCLVHFKRNIQKLQLSGDITDPNVLSAMYSLASTEPHADFSGALATIRAGGKKARDWLHDKEVSCPFAIPALYHPYSKIPLHVWLAGASNSNGVEQAHRNVNRDGKGLPLVGGIQRGRQYDAREEKSTLVMQNENIAPRYGPATHAMRQERAIVRNVRGAKRKLEAADENIIKRRARVEELQARVTSSAASFQAALQSGDSSAATTASRYLFSYEDDLAAESAALSSAELRGPIFRIPIFRILVLANHPPSAAISVCALSVYI